MEFKIVTNKELSRIRVVTKSEHYIVGSTGGQVKIFNSEMEHLKTITNVFQVYGCYISPNEKNLLLVSMANIFYVLSMETFHMKKYTIKGKYNGNLEGEGCWTLDGRGCCFCVSNRDNGVSALRIYEDIESGNYCEILTDAFCLTSIFPIPSEKKYLLSGYDRTDDKCCLIWYDGNTFEKHPIEDYDDTIRKVIYNTNDSTCTVCGLTSTIQCSAQGKHINRIELPQSSASVFDFFSVFTNVPLSQTARETLREKIHNWELTCLQDADSIRDVAYSQLGPYLYIATTRGLLCINYELNKIEAEVIIPYGVTEILKLSEELLIISTWESARLIRICFGE